MTSSFSRRSTTREWQEAARLWVALVGDPSTMKTPMIYAATKPLRRIDNEMARDNQDAMDEWLQAAERGTEEDAQSRSSPGP